MQQAQVLVVDLGSQYSLVIARKLRELAHRSAVLSPKRSAQWLASNIPRCIILSGGYASVYDEGAPQPPKEILRLNVPLLGICYGSQWIAHTLGGRVEPAPDAREYGEAWITPDRSDPLFSVLGEREQVWASHGDTITRLPRGYRQIASANGHIAAMSNPDQRIWGVQFHPEVVNTSNGGTMLRAFVETIAGCERDWQPGAMIEELRDEVVTTVGNRRAVIGFSGGVDSSTLSAILAPVFGERLLGVCIDHGGLREGELDEVRANAKAVGVQLKIVSAEGQFSSITKTTDAEEKRQHFKAAYASILREETRRHNGDLIVQGSLATDFIESAGHGAADLIKSHHNYGLELGYDQLHPFNQIFKYEVRALAESLGLPPSITQRHPFPGPGLYLRVNGAPATRERRATVRWADARTREIATKYSLDDEYSQLVVSLNCTRRVGVKGDKRVYASSIEVRALCTMDFMTGQGYYWPESPAREITRAVTKHPDVVAVLFNPTDKPPCTTEPE